MGIYSNGHVKNADYFINLTSTEIKVYEDYTGSIWGFPPERYGPVRKNRNNVYYIVTQSLLDLLRKHDFPLDDIAVVSRKDIGRKGKIVSYLTWGKDSSINIRLRNSDLCARCARC